MIPWKFVAQQRAILERPHTLRIYHLVILMQILRRRYEYQVRVDLFSKVD